MEAEGLGEKKFVVSSRLDTEPELKYFEHGGILNFVLRKLLGGGQAKL